MFRIKICGITNREDALVVAQSGADALGLNFFPASPRYIPPRTAQDIVETLPTGMVKVGLFVGAPAADVCRWFDELHLDLIQIHGDEPPEYLPQLGDRPVMRAFRVGPGGARTVLEYLERCRDLAALPRCVLLDALVAGKYGGTGKLADWNIAKEYLAGDNMPPLVLAGGLTPQNVAEAIRTVRPAAVDVAGGVESSPGHKDPIAVASFAQAARTQWSP